MEGLWLPVPATQLWTLQGRRSSPQVSHPANGTHWAPYVQGPADKMRSHQFARVTGFLHQKAGPLSHMQAEKDTCALLGCLWAAPFPILVVNGCVDKGSDSSRWKVGVTTLGVPWGPARRRLLSVRVLRMVEEEGEDEDLSWPWDLPQWWGYGSPCWPPPLSVPWKQGPWEAQGSWCLGQGRQPWRAHWGHRADRQPPGTFSDPIVPWNAPVQPLGLWEQVVPVTHRLHEGESWAVEPLARPEPFTPPWQPQSTCPRTPPPPPLPRPAPALHLSQMFSWILLHISLAPPSWRTLTSTSSFSRMVAFLLSPAIFFAHCFCRKCLSGWLLTVMLEFRWALSETEICFCQHPSIARWEEKGLPCVSMCSLRASVQWEGPWLQELQMVLEGHGVLGPLRAIAQGWFWSLPDADLTQTHHLSAETCHKSALLGPGSWAGVVGE